MDLLSVRVVDRHAITIIAFRDNRAQLVAAEVIVMAWTSVTLGKAKGGSAVFRDPPLRQS